MFEPAARSSVGLPDSLSSSGDEKPLGSSTHSSSSDFIGEKLIQEKSESESESQSVCGSEPESVLESWSEPFEGGSSLSIDINQGALKDV